MMASDKKTHSWLGGEQELPDMKAILRGMGINTMPVSNVVFKAGDKVRIIKGTPEELHRKGKGEIQYKIGDILELVNDADTNSPYFRLSSDEDRVCFSSEQGAAKNKNGQRYFRIKISYIELVVHTRHKCHCPPENFHYNGNFIGCVCNGE